MSRPPFSVRRTQHQIDHLPAYTADELARIAEVDAATGHLFDSARTAVALTRRAAVHHGTTPAQMVAFLRDEEKRAREEMSK